MRHIPDHLHIPWWRVVAKSGALPVSKLDPHLGKEQRDRLLAEGVPFLSEWVVDMAACEWDPRD